MRQSSLEQQLLRTEDKLDKGRNSLPGELQDDRNCMACDITCDRAGWRTKWLQAKIMYYRVAMRMLIFVEFTLADLYNCCKTGSPIHRQATMEISKNTSGNTPPADSRDISRGRAAQSSRSQPDGEEKDERKDEAEKDQPESSKVKPQMFWYPTSDTEYDGIVTPEDEYSEWLDLGRWHQRLTEDKKGSTARAAVNGIHGSLSAAGKATGKWLSDHVTKFGAQTL